MGGCGCFCVYDLLSFFRASGKLNCKWELSFYFISQMFFVISIAQTERIAAESTHNASTL